MWSCCSHREPSIVRICLEIVPADTFNGWSVIANEGRAPTDELMMQWPLWILLDRSSGITTRLHRPSAAHSPEDGGVSRLSLSMTAQAVTIRLRRNPLETRSQRVENSPDSVSCQLSATFQIGVVSFGRTIAAATPVYELFCPPIRFLYDTKKSGTEVNPRMVCLRARRSGSALDHSRHRAAVVSPPVVVVLVAGWEIWVADPRRRATLLDSRWPS